MTDKEQLGAVEATASEAANATRADLEKLNGLLIRTLIQKLEDGKATSTDIGSAVKVLVSNRVQPGDAQDVHQSFTTQGTYPFSPLDFPISI